jgi:7-keto-8-aminopelargonate synthetase-like enzyme
MLNKKQANNLNPLINNEQAWNSLEEYLQELTQLTIQALVAARSELEVFQLQGKLALLEQIKKLKNDHKAVVQMKDS